MHLFSVTDMVLIIRFVYLGKGGRQTFHELMVIDDCINVYLLPLLENFTIRTLACITRILFSMYRWC